MYLYHEQGRPAPDRVSEIPVLFPDESILTFSLTFNSYMQYHIDSCPAEKGENYRLAKEFGQQLLDNCKEALGQNPLYKDGKWCSRFLNARCANPFPS